jgi:outer membrane protein assembly factor BamA
MSSKYSVDFDSNLGKIDEGEKLKVTNVGYRGNLALTGEDLNNLFKKNATTLALAGYYDKIFFENYSDILTKEYLSKGFVFAEISKPRITTKDDDETLEIEFGIAEKQQVMLKMITLKGVEASFQTAIKNLLTNKEGTSLNVVELEADLKKIISYFQEKGY